LYTIRWTGLEPKEDRWSPPPSRRSGRPLDTVVNAHMGAVCDRSAVEEPVGPEFQPSPSLGRYVDELGNPLVGNAKKVPGVSKRDTNFNQLGGRFGGSAD
jgi:hypothetical protein